MNCSFLNIKLRKSPQTVKKMLRVLYKRKSFKTINPTAYSIRTPLSLHFPQGIIDQGINGLQKFNCFQKRNHTLGHAC